MSKINRKKARASVHRRIRRKVGGTAERPRLAVHFSNQNVYAQVIDDASGCTLVSASSVEKSVSSKGANVATATEIGRTIAERAQAAKVSTVVFDRGGYIFHGKVKALADAAREGGLKF